MSPRLKVCGCGRLVPIEVARCPDCERMSNAKKTARARASGRAGRAWPKTRSRVLYRDGHTCQHCGSTEDLTVHRFSEYGPIHDGRLEAYTTLCRTCHGSISG